MRIDQKVIASRNKFKKGADLRHYPPQIVILTEIKIIFSQYKILLLNIAINLIFKIIRLRYQYGGAV